MKSIKLIRSAWLTFTLSLLSILAFAQDTASISTTVRETSTTTESFEPQPWMWIVGGAVLLLLLVALLRPKNKSGESVTVKKTVERE